MKGFNPQSKDNDFENECQNQDVMINTDRSSVINPCRKLSVKFEKQTDENSVGRASNKETNVDQIEISPSKKKNSRSKHHAFNDILSKKLTWK